MSEQLAKLDDAFAFYDANAKIPFRKYRLETSGHGRRVFRNALGWELRRVSPYSHVFWTSTAVLGNLKRVARWDVYDAAGEFVASEPTFYSALRSACTRFFEGSSRDALRTVEEMCRE